MSKLEKLLAQVISGRADANIACADLCRLLHRLGFAERIRGSHHIFSISSAEKPSRSGSICRKAAPRRRPYQVKQVRAVIVKYGLEVKE